MHNDKTIRTHLIQLLVLGLGGEGTLLYIASLPLGEDSAYLLSPPWSDRQPFTKSGLAPMSRGGRCDTHTQQGSGTRIGPRTPWGASDTNIQQ